MIVPDADWIDNAMVINQAKLCQTALNRFGVQEVHVAAPPRTFNGRNTKGVDDFIGAGGRLDDLTVIDNNPPAGLNEWIASRTTRRDQARRDEWLLWALATYTGSGGVLKAPLSTVARVIGLNKMAVSRAIKDLVQMGAVTIDGDLAAKRGWFTGQYEWKERPAITLIPELRSVEMPEQRLGDLIPFSLRVHEGVPT